MQSRARVAGVVVVAAVAALLPLVVLPAPASAAVGDISTVAGTGVSGYLGNCADPLLADLSLPNGIAVGPDGTVRFVDAGNNRVRWLGSGVPAKTIELLAGSGAFGFSGDGGPATGAAVGLGSGVAVDSSGNSYLADFWNNRVRRVDTSGVITTIAGTGVVGSTGDGGQATSAQLTSPEALAYDSVNNRLFIGQDGGDRIRVVDLDTGVIETVETGISATGLAYSSDLLFASEASTHRVWKIDLKTKTTTVFAGTGVAGFSGDGGPGASAQLDTPFGLAFDGPSRLLVADVGNDRIRTVRIGDGAIGTFAGTGTPGFLGDGGAATAARFNAPVGLANDASGGVYVTDSGNQRIRYIDASDKISTVAGTGTDGYAGDSDSPCVTADQAQFFSLAGMDVDEAGNVYVADSSNHRFRRVDAITGAVSTVAGTGANAVGATGIRAVESALSYPRDVKVLDDGDLLVLHSGADPLRRVDAATGLISSVGYDNGPGPDGGLGDMALDLDGSLVVANNTYGRVERVDLATGSAVEIAGGGSGPGSEDDGIPALSADFSAPSDLVVDEIGNIFVALIGDDKVRRIDVATGIVTTVAGSGVEGSTGDGGPATDAQINPAALFVDTGGLVYIGDFTEGIRRVQADGTIDTVDMGTTNRVSDLVLDPQGNLAFTSTQGLLKSMEVESPATGLLRVTTNPAVPGTIVVDGVPRDSWGLTWLPVAVGEHEVCFGAVAGFSSPPCEVVDVMPGQTTTVQGDYEARGYLRVTTNPAVPSTISVDGVPRNDWGVWTEVDPGTYEVCFGPVEGFAPPPCEEVVVSAGATAQLDGVFPVVGVATGETDPHGFLRATTSPAVGSRITIDGEFADSWGLTWVKLAPGSYEVCFEDVLYATAPECETAVITDGATAVVEGDFTQHGFVQVSTSPAVPATVYIDGQRANAWGVYTSLEPGEHSVCFGPVAGLVAPPCEVIDVTAGVTTPVAGIYSSP